MRPTFPIVSSNDLVAKFDPFTIFTMSSALMVAESLICDIDYQRSTQLQILSDRTAPASHTPGSTQSSRPLSHVSVFTNDLFRTCRGLFLILFINHIHLLHTYRDLAPSPPLCQDECTAATGPSWPVHKSGCSHWESHPTQPLEHHHFPYHCETRSRIANPIVGTTKPRPSSKPQE